MSIHHPASESRFAKSSHATVSTLKFIRTYQRTIPPRPGVADSSSRELNSPLQRSAKLSVQGVTDVQELRETASRWNNRRSTGRPSAMNTVLGWKELQRRAFRPKPL
jgi:hypothetical protein